MSAMLADGTGQGLLAEREPIAAREDERETLVRAAAFLRRQRGQQARLIGLDDEVIELPESAFLLLQTVIHQLACDNAVSIVPVQKQLTTQQAADLLNISRPYLIKLLERGELPYQKIGSHRRLHFGAVMAYRERRAVTEEAALDELLLLDDELGL